MRDNLAEQIELAVRRRAVKLPNVLPLATLFDPRLPGFTMPVQPALNIPRPAPALPIFCNSRQPPQRRTWLIQICASCNDLQPFCAHAAGSRPVIVPVDAAGAAVRETGAGDLDIARVEAQCGGRVSMAGRVHADGPADQPPSG
jgi:hypothetical protein